MSKNNVQMKKAIAKVAASLKALPKEELLKRIEEHSDGDFAKILMELDDFAKGYYSGVEFQKAEIRKSMKAFRKKKKRKKRE